MSVGKKVYKIALKLPLKIVFYILILAVFLFPIKAENTLIYLTPVAICNLDPGICTDTYSVRVLSNIFEGLVRHKKGTQEIEACLAEKWTVKDNGKKWTFYLRKGVKFHNGEIFNAEAVVLTFKNRLNKKKEYKNWNIYYSHISNINALDDFTVEFILKKPYIPFLYSLANTRSHIIAPSSYAQNSFKPIGTGPFKFLEWNRDKYLTISGNKKYWRGKVHLSKVVFKVVKDAGWRMLQIKNGKADLAFISSKKEFNEIRGRTDIKILSIPSQTIHYLAFNIRKRPFNDLKVRKAFAHMFNKKKMIKYIFEDFAKNATSPVPSHIFGFNRNIKDYDFDINIAKSLLKEAGYENGFKVSLYFSSGSNNLDSIANKLKRAAKKVDIQIIKIAVPFAQLRRAADKGEHNIIMLGWAGDNPDPDSFLYSAFTTKKGNLNRSGYNNPEFTGIIEEAQKTMNKKKRGKLYFKAQEIIHRDLPWIPLFNLNDIIIYNKKVKNIYIDQSTNPVFRNVYFDEN